MIVVTVKVDWGQETIQEILPDHARFGFEEVGHSAEAGTPKVVSYQVTEI